MIAITPVSVQSTFALISAALLLRRILIDEKMAKRKCNTYFTNPYRLGRQPATESSFEQVVHALCLTPEQYATSRELKSWVSRNKSYKYVPPDVLVIFGFEAGADV